jgi:hypothetical protein
MVKARISPVSTFKTLPKGAYCATDGYTGYEYIDKVQLGSFVNQSGDNGGYADYTALTKTLIAGVNITLRLHQALLSVVLMTNTGRYLLIITMMETF